MTKQMELAMSAFLTIVAIAVIVHLTQEKDPTVKLSYFKLEEDLHFEGCEPQTPVANSKTSCARSCWSAGANCALFSFRKSFCVTCSVTCFICASGDVVTNLTFSSVSFIKPHQVDLNSIVNPSSQQLGLSSITSGRVFYLRCIMLDNGGLILVFLQSGGMISFYFRARNDGYYGDKDVVLTDMWQGRWRPNTLFRTNAFLFNKTVEIHVLFQTDGAVFYVNRKYLASYPNSGLPPTAILYLQLSGNLFIERMYV